MAQPLRQLSDKGWNRDLHLWKALGLVRVGRYVCHIFDFLLLSYISSWRFKASCKYTKKSARIGSNLKPATHKSGSLLLHTALYNNFNFCSLFQGLDCSILSLNHHILSDWSPRPISSLNNLPHTHTHKKKQIFPKWLTKSLPKMLITKNERKKRKTQAVANTSKPLNYLSQSIMTLECYFDICQSFSTWRLHFDGAHLVVNNTRCGINRS